MSSFFRTLFSPKILKSVNGSFHSWKHKIHWHLAESSIFMVSKRRFSDEKADEVKQRSKDWSLENYVPFDKMVSVRRDEARRSILVQVQSESSCSELYSYCNEFGLIETMHYYSMNQAHFILVEFKDESSIKSILAHGTHLEKDQVVPVRSPLLWFRTGSKKKKKMNSSVLNTPVPYSSQNLSLPSTTEFYNMLLEAKSVSDQVMILYEYSKLNDVGSRLRFLSARQVELVLSGLFPFIQVLPFGSSVNSFGKIGCDLDLVMILDPEAKDQQNSRLVFHAKTSLNNGRAQIQRQMETIADLLQLFLPGCSQVRKILQARVPIIKYNQDLTSIECDLSMTNLTAIYMSELLYLFGCTDWRVRPLVFSVRWWAKEVMLTNPSNPGRWITNFSLTLLVIFFLQRVHILPSLDSLIKVAGPEDIRISDDGVNCTFLRDLSKLSLLKLNKPKNLHSLEELLCNFFEYYASFDFSSKAISINSANIISKPEYSSLYIVNPLEKSLNVSKNVSLEETERFKIEARNAAWYLDANANPEENNQSTAPWGLLEIIKNQKEKVKSQQQIFNEYLKSPLKHDNRLISVEELFSDFSENNEDPVSSSKSKLKQSKNNKFVFAKRR